MCAKKLPKDKIEKVFNIGLDQENTPFSFFKALIQHADHDTKFELIIKYLQSEKCDSAQVAKLIKANIEFYQNHNADHANKLIEIILDLKEKNYFNHQDIINLFQDNAVLTGHLSHSPLKDKIFTIFQEGSLNFFKMIKDHRAHIIKESESIFEKFSKKSQGIVAGHYEAINDFSALERVMKPLTLVLWKYADEAAMDAGVQEYSKKIHQLLTVASEEKKLDESSLKHARDGINYIGKLLDKDLVRSQLEALHPEALPSQIENLVRKKTGTFTRSILNACTYLRA